MSTVNRFHCLTCITSGYKPGATGQVQLATLSEHPAIISANISIV